MSTRIKYSIQITGVALCFLFSSLLSCYADDPVDETIKTLQQPQVYEVVAKRLALYCQSDHSAFPEMLDYAWFPHELRETGTGGGYVGKKSARIDAGILEKFGYKLSLDSSESDGRHNIWKLEFYHERLGKRLLTTLSLDKSENLSSDEIVTMVSEGYDSQIKKVLATEIPDGLLKPRLHFLIVSSIQLYLRFDKVDQARRECRILLKNRPDDWWVVLTNSLLDACVTNAKGGKLINSWVNTKPNYFRYMDLAYFYQLTNQPTKARNAVLKAIDFEGDVGWVEDGNAEFRGYTAAMYMYDSGFHKECRMLCEKLIPMTNNGEFAKRGLRKLSNAAELGIAGKAPVVKWDNQIMPFDPFSIVDIDQLLGRKLERYTEHEFRYHYQK